jgi:hypothetical protein
MRTIVITVAAIALLTVSTRAQQNPTTPWLSLPTKDQPSDHTPDEHSTAPKANDKAYRSALDGITQIKDHDPWRSVRDSPKSKTPH